MLLKSNNFIDEIESICINNNVEYIDAVVNWCSKHNLEIEYIAEIIKKNPIIKSKIQIEAENLNFLKKSARLPV